MKAFFYVPARANACSAGALAAPSFSKKKCSDLRKKFPKKILLRLGPDKISATFNIYTSIVTAPTGAAASCCSLLFFIGPIASGPIHPPASDLFGTGLVGVGEGEWRANVLPVSGRQQFDR